MIKLSFRSFFVCRMYIFWNASDQMDFDDFHLEALFQQVPIHTQPVVAGGLHANKQVIF